MKVKIKACILGLFCPLLAYSQETGLLRLTSGNKEPLTQVSVWGGVEDGRLKPAQAAQTLWKAGAEGKLFRSGKKSSWTGLVSLEQTMGKHYGASLFLEPEYFPMDFLDLSTGTSSRQTGRVELGYLGDLSDIWAAGFNASFKAMNASKKMESPFSSFGMEARFEPTLTFESDDDACIVSTYHVQLRTERAKADQEFFFDRGMSYGALESVTLFPVMELSHGFFESYHSPIFSLGFGISWKRGKAGEPDYSLFRFPGSTLKGYFERMLEGFEVDKTYRISYQRQRDQLREILPEGDLHSLSDRAERTLTLQFGFLPHNGSLKSLAVEVEGNHWFAREMMYYYDSIKQFGGTAKLLSSLSFGKVDLDTDLSAGMGWWQDKGLTDESEEGAPRLTENWLKKMDYRMVPRMGVGGTLTWHTPFLKGLSIQLYARWLRAFKASHLGGKNREIATLTFAYNY